MAQAALSTRGRTYEDAAGNPVYVHRRTEHAGYLSTVETRIKVVEPDEQNGIVGGRREYVRWLVSEHDVQHVNLYAMSELNDTIRRHYECVEAWLDMGLLTAQ